MRRSNCFESRPDACKKKPVSVLVGRIENITFLVYQQN